MYFMTHEQGTEWRPCKALTFQTAKREATQLYGKGFIDDVLKVGEGSLEDGIATLSTKSNSLGSRWVDDFSASYTHQKVDAWFEDLIGEVQYLHRSTLSLHNSLMFVHTRAGQRLLILKAQATLSRLIDAYRDSVSKNDVLDVFDDLDAPA